MSRIVLAVDSSQIKQFMTCQKKWYWRYVKQIVPRGHANFILDRGTLAHAILDTYYKNIQRLGPTAAYLHTRRVLDVAKLNLQTLKSEDIQFVWERFQAYTRHYSQADFLPISPESVEIGFSKVLVDSPTHLFIIEGRIDLITSDHCVVDHKTQEKANNYYNYDPQWKTYCWATGMRKALVNYFGCQKVINEQTFRRQVITMPEAMIAEWEKRMINYLYQMAGCIQSGIYELNETHCTAYYRTCEYEELDTQYNPEIQKQLIQVKYEKAQKWEPWKLEEIK